MGTQMGYLFEWLSKLITRLNAYSSTFKGAKVTKCEQQVEQLEKSLGRCFSLGSSLINTKRSFDKYLYINFWGSYD